jgi:hypothetical protein
VRSDRLRALAPWFAFAAPMLLILAGITAFLVVLVAVANHGPGSPFPPPPDPPWYGAAEVVAVVSFGLSLVSQLMVALALQRIDHARTVSTLTYVGLAGAAASLLAYIPLLLGQLFTAGNVALTAIWSVIVAGAGIYLVAMNIAGVRSRLLGRILGLTGETCGVLLLLVALSNLVNWPGVGLALVLAVLLYITWSVWLGFRLRAPAFTAGAVTKP